MLAIERQAYASEIQEPAAIVQARLRYEDDQYSSLNLGLYANDDLVGYVLAHLDDGAEFPDARVASNIYVADLAILPAHRRGLADLVSALAREIRLEYPGLPIVAHAIADTAEKWRRHDLLFQRLGFRMARKIENLATGPRHRASLIVWEPTPGAGHSAGRQRASDRVALAAFVTSSGRVLGTRIVTDEDGLIGLGESWERLEDKVPGLTVFQTHRYQAAWVRNFGIDRKLMIVCVYDGDDIIGIAPFQVRRSRCTAGCSASSAFSARPGKSIARGSCARGCARVCRSDGRGVAQPARSLGRDLVPRADGRRPGAGSVLRGLDAARRCCRGGPRVRVARTWRSRAAGRNCSRRSRRNSART